MLVAEWRRMPVAPQDGDLAQSADRQAPPVPRRIGWSETSLARPAELIEEGVRNALLGAQHVRAHVSDASPIGSPNRLSVQDRLPHDLIWTHATSVPRSAGPGREMVWSNEGAGECRRPL